MDAEKDSEVEEKVLSVTKAPEVISIDDNEEDDQPALEKNADIQNNDSEAKEAEKHIDGPMDIVEDKESRENVGSDKEKPEAESGKDVTAEASKSVEVVEEMEEAAPEPESIDKEKLNENQDAGSKQKGGTDDDIILIDDEKEITEKADSKEQQISEPEKSSDKEEPAQKKGRLSTEEKEGFQSVTDDSENAESKEQQVSDKGESSDKEEPVQEKGRLSTEEQEESQLATENSEQSKKQQETRETHEAKEGKPVGPMEEKSEDDSNVKEDDDVVMVECESKSTETTGNSEEAKRQQKETTETHEAKEGESLNPAEKEPADPKVKEDEVKEGKPVSPAEEKSAADSNVKEDNDVVMVECESKSSETAGDSEGSKKKQETPETHEAKEGGSLSPAAKEPAPDPKVKEEEVKEEKSVSPAEEKSAADSNVKEGDDVVMVEDEAKSSEPAVDSEESKKQQKETTETHEAKEGEPLNPAEKEPTPDTKVKEDEVKEGKPMGSVVEKSAADTKVKEDDDVVMMRCESKSSKTTDRDEKKPEEMAATPKMEDNDDVMLIESDEHPKEATTDKSKTDKKDSTDKDQSGAPSKDATDKDQSGTPSKDESDDVMVVECQESIADSDSETDKKEEKVESSKKDEVQKEAATKPTTVEDTADKPTEKAESDESKADNQPEKSTPTKRFVLDEKSGMFEEKEAPPEEPVPQVFGDSDEDVVMVDNYVTTDRKSAAKPAPAPPPKPQPVAPKSTAAAQPLPTKEVSKEVSKPKSSSSSSATVECINMECKKESKETAPAPGFVLNFFGIPKKSKKQRICVNCYDEVVEKYSVLGGAVLDQQPLLFCEMPRKNELVEISDSSEEEEDEDVKLESEKPLSSDIISLVESELNDIISSTFEKININQQIDWTEQIMKQKIAYNSKLSNEINNELNELQRKVDRIHLQLYSKSRPRYQDLPPCNIFEVDPQTRQAVVQQSTAPSRPYTPQRPSIQQQLPQQQRQQAQMTVGIQAAASPSGPAAPKKEEFSRPAVNVGQFYFAVKHKLLSNWAECQVVEAVSVADKSLYKVNFLYNQGAGAAPIKVVPAKYLAYRHSFNVKLPLGTRVIARFDAGTTLPSAKQSQQAKNNSFYPGIIAESFGKYNRNRYLIFFDDGYAQYVTHGDVRVVCEESKEVWSDIHPHSQEFIKNYLMNYRSQRPMVQVKVGQRIITEWKGKWIYAKVIDIDASLVQLHFADDNRYEWIYRGSTRLGPLYQEKALSMSKASNKFSKFQKRNEPSIEYITLDDDEENDQNKQQEARKPSTTQELALQSFKNLQLNQADSANRSVAKKSTFHRAVPASQPSAVFMNSSTIYCEDDRPKGKIVYYTAKKHLPPLKYKPHECNPSCLFKITHNLKSYSPMAKPLLSGWERQLCKMKYKKVFVVYRAPCGRRVRNMYELHMYLRMTKATLNVENFDFDPMIHCLAEYVIENHIYHNPDLSDGREFMAVPCVNYFDDTKPPPCIYSTERIPTEGVNLNLDSDFLCGCDCEDDCIDKTRCQCWQLTVAGAKFGNPNTPIDNIGYVYKRLQEAVVTGIYECNSRCKCKSNCLNRVVQHPLMTKLQVFKTSNRGWGIRCLNDVAKGSFICIYSGHLLTEEAGNNICESSENKAGDEYFADLDYIETVEQLKEGYETDVVESESEAESDYDARQDSGASDDDFTASTNPTDAAVKTRSQAKRDSRQRNENKSEKKFSKKKEDTKTGSDDEREMVNLIPNSDMTKEDAPSPAIKYRSVRKYFGKHEQIYIMDAKKSGNLGRYFNHSCNPNLFVQNVFVDTHDLRFPWVAFFALCNVRAGSELTWNYNYDVGSVPGKVLYCQCGAENCRQRLL